MLEPWEGVEVLSFFFGIMGRKWAGTRKGLGWGGHCDLRGHDQRRACMPMRMPSLAVQTEETLLM